MQPFWKTDIDIKTKYMHSYDPVIPLSDILPACPPLQMHAHVQKDMNKNVCSSIICNRSKLETTQLSNNSRMDKVLHTMNCYRGLKMNRL